MSRTLRKLGAVAGATLLALFFGYASWQVLGRTRQSLDPGLKVIRIGHYQLESGVRGAIDAVAAAYMRRNPGVRIEQLAVPGRVYPTWLKTQLTGGTAPDLIELAPALMAEDKARYLLPLDEYLAQPNPYNAGTELAGTAWRQTFVDGLINPPAHDADLLQTFGIPSSQFTLRLFYNRALLQEITGADRPPADYPGLLALFRRTVAFSAREGRRLYAAAGSKQNAPTIFYQLFLSQTEAVRKRFDPFGDMQRVYRTTDLAYAYLRGDWTMGSPGPRDGWERIREIGLFFKPGFYQMERDDALFDFVQGRALMIMSGNWDAQSLSSQAPFAVGAIELPLPDARDGSVGPISEGGRETQACFALSRTSAHPEVAADFLRFLGSMEGSRIFAEHSAWLPAVVGVKPPPGLEVFMPRQEGRLGGFRPYFTTSETEPRRVFDENLHLLLGTQGSVDAFLQAFEPAYRDAVKAALDYTRRADRRLLVRQDSLLGAQWWLAQAGQDQALREPAARRLDLLVEMQLQRTSNELWSQWQRERLP
jgi:raffinose/stachyose/melibiose transport system substrate-binding protein